MAPDLGDRVLVLAPTARDGVASRDLLAGAGVRSHLCATIADVCREAALGAGAALVTAEAIVGDADGRLTELLKAQPRWSDLPVIVLTPPGPDSTRLLKALEAVGSTTLMKRPVQVSTLTSVVRGALRDRRRQYEVRDLLTERERATEVLRVERERYRVTLSSIGDAVIATDAGGGVTFLNPVAEALTGWAAAEAAGRPLTDVFRIVNEATRREVENPALRALANGVIVGLANHTVLIARDGTERPIDDSAAPIRENGSVGGAVLVFRDITERKRAEESRARLAAIIESSDDAIIGKTLDGVIRFWNAGAERVFGYSAAEAVGRPITLIIPPDRLDEEREIIERVRRGKRIDHFETVRRTRDGRPVDISLTVSPIRDAHGTVIGASKVARDITDRRRAEAERERLAETLWLALDAGELGTWEWDPATDGMVLSERAGAIYGVEPGVPHSREQLRGLLHPDHRDRAREGAARTVAARADYDIEYPLVSGRWVAARGRGAFGPDGILTRMIGVAQDVTARKAAEAALRESEARYRAIVEATPECVKLVGPDGTLMQMNRAGLAMIEGDESALGQCVYAVVAPEDRERFVAFNERICRGERGSLEFDIIGLRGTRRHMETTAVPLPAAQGGFTQLAVTRDMTARHRAEEALRASERRLTEVFHHAPSFMAVLRGPDHVFELV
ncbi:MAG TPA: PAS domain S-box protein, partial [Urbifossiella sp.]|nr:PAS domain S-box protein [Urbifossiella sp.]